MMVTNEPDTQFTDRPPLVVLTSSEINQDLFVWHVYR